MPYTPGYSDPNAEPEHEYALLPIDDHYARLLSFEVVPADQSQYNKEQLKWTFVGLDYKDEHERPGISSVWTGTDYGNPKAKLTQLIDGFFGRSLTQDEIRRIDFERLPNAIEGWIRVKNVGDRQRPKSGFDLFMLASDAPLPNPADFFVVQSRPQAPQRPAPMSRPGPAQMQQYAAPQRQTPAPAAAPAQQQRAPVPAGQPQRPTNGTYTQSNATRPTAGAGAGYHQPAPAAQPDYDNAPFEDPFDE